MVAKVWTPASEIEDLGEAFRAETVGMLKKVAFENNCDVNELKFSVNNLGVVNIQRMTPQEMIDRASQRIVQKRIVSIKKSRES